MPAAPARSAETGFACPAWLGARVQHGARGDSALPDVSLAQLTAPQLAATQSRSTIMNGCELPEYVRHESAAGFGQ